jgi:hypothetical protein
MEADAIPEGRASSGISEHLLQSTGVITSHVMPFDECFCTDLIRRKLLSVFINRSVLEFLGAMIMR